MCNTLFKSYSSVIKVSKFNTNQSNSSAKYLFNKRSLRNDTHQLCVGVFELHWSYIYHASAFKCKMLAALKDWCSNKAEPSNKCTVYYCCVMFVE